MEFWSAGLSRRGELSIACGTERPERRGDDLVLAGTVRAPVTWAYTVTLDQASWAEVIEIGLTPEFARLIGSRPHRWRLLARLIRLAWGFAAAYLVALARRSRAPAAVLPVAASASPGAKEGRGP